MSKWQKQKQENLSIIYNKYNNNTIIFYEYTRIHYLEQPYYYR